MNVVNVKWLHSQISATNFAKIVLFIENLLAMLSVLPIASFGVYFIPIIMAPSTLIVWISLRHFSLYELRLSPLNFLYSFAYSEFLMRSFHPYKKDKLFESHLSACKHTCTKSTLCQNS